MNRTFFDDDIDYEWHQERDILPVKEGKMTKYIAIETCDQCPYRSTMITMFDCYRTQQVNHDYPKIPSNCPLENLSEVQNV